MVIVEREARRDQDCRCLDCSGARHGVGRGELRLVVRREIQQRRQVGRGIGGGAGFPVCSDAVAWAGQGWQEQARGLRSGWQGIAKQEKTHAQAMRKWNWRIWSGFLLAVAVVPGYFLFFARFPITRNVPWASWLMFAAAGGLLWAGVSRAFTNPGVYRGKMVGPILALLS